MDTMRTAKEWALSELIRHPRIMEKAQQELETVLVSFLSLSPGSLSLSMDVQTPLFLNPITRFFQPEPVIQRVNPLFNGLAKYQTGLVYI